MSENNIETLLTQSNLPHLADNPNQIRTIPEKSPDLLVNEFLLSRFPEVLLYCEGKFFSNL